MPFPFTVDASDLSVMDCMFHIACAMLTVSRVYYRVSGLMKWRGRALVWLSSARRTAGRHGPHSAFSLSVFFSKDPTKRGRWVLDEKATSLERDTLFYSISQYVKLFYSVHKFVKKEWDQQKETEKKSTFLGHRSPNVHILGKELFLCNKTQFKSPGVKMQNHLFLMTVNVNMAFPKYAFDRIVGSPEGTKF